MISLDLYYFLVCRVILYGVRGVMVDQVVRVRYGGYNIFRFSYGSIWLTNIHATAFWSRRCWNPGEGNQSTGWSDVPCDSQPYTCVLATKRKHASVNIETDSTSLTSHFPACLLAGYFFTGVGALNAKKQKIAQSSRGPDRIFSENYKANTTTVLRNALGDSVA